MMLARLAAALAATTAFALAALPAPAAAGDPQAPPPVQEQPWELSEAEAQAEARRLQVARARALCSDAMLAAARYGDEEQLRLTLQTEPADCVDGALRTPLHLSASAGTLQITMMLLSAGALMDRDTMGRTALHYAAEAGQVELMGVLLDSGAYLEFEDYTQRTALHHAARRGHLEAVRVLLDRGSLIDAADGDRRTALHMTARSDAYYNTTTLLTSRGAFTDTEDAIGFQPLHFACMLNMQATVRLLMDLGASVMATDKSGFSPLAHAAAGGHRELVDYIVVRVLSPRTFPLPDPVNFIEQDPETPVLGMPAWMLVLVTSAIVSCGAVTPIVVNLRRFRNVHKAFHVTFDDQICEEYIEEIFESMAGSTKQITKLCEKWDSLPAHTLGDLHRVKK